MKEIFDRHASALNPPEREDLWERIATSRGAHPGASRLRPLAGAAMLLAMLGTIALLGRDLPSTLRSRMTANDASTTTSVSGLDSRRNATVLEGSPPPSATSPPSVTVFRDAHRLPIADLDEAALGSPEGDLHAVAPSSAEAAAPLPISALEEVSGIHVEGERKPVPLTTRMSMRSGGIATKPGVAAGGQLHVRGGRPDEVRIQFDGVPHPSLEAPRNERPMSIETGDAMFFKNYGVNPFVATEKDARSTFAVDVDAASYTLARRYLAQDQLPPPEAVRVEEFINYFPQGYASFEDDDFRIHVEGAPSPFGRGHHLLRVGLKARDVARRDRKPAQLTFVIDVSGSMDMENRLELVKRSLRLLVDQLHGDDRVGIVVYGDVGRVVLEPAELNERPALALRGWRDADDEGVGRSGKRRILDAIDRLHPEGSTNAEDGLRLGYDMARRAYRRGAINRIVLCSDGVANVGNTGPASILERVRTEADRGIHLSTVGFGMGNYNDVLMEQLANQGDGNYHYVDDIDEARRVFIENLTGTLQTIAQDAKVQVEFDPSQVSHYRLLGFENRDVADRDFRNDAVDAGEVGAGHEVTALYEVTLTSDLRRDEAIATVRLRYARPAADGRGPGKAREITRDFMPVDLVRRFEDASPYLRLDAAVAEFAEILKRSYWARDGRLSDVLSVARRAARQIPGDAPAAFVSLVEKAKRIEPAPSEVDEDR